MCRTMKKAMDFSPMAFRIVLYSFPERCYIFLKTTGDGFNPILRRERRNSPAKLCRFDFSLFTESVIFRKSEKI